MNVAIFTDTDFDALSDAATALRAAMDGQPPHLRLRIYTAATLGVCAANYLALPAVALPVPFCGDMRVHMAPIGEFVRYAREDRIDVVHITSVGPVGLAGLRVASKLGVPVIGSCHADLATDASALSGSSRIGSWMRAYVRWVYERCARILVPSRRGCQTLVDTGLEAGRVGVWPTAVDGKLFAPHRRLFRLRERWHVAENRPALLYVGRLSRERGVGLLPAVHDQLHALRVQHRFVLVGEGPMRKELELRMPDALFTGVLSGAALAEVFASADCCMLPGDADLCGNRALQAQASGIPVAAAESSGACEYMLPERTGIICPAATPSVWAERLAVLLSHPLMRGEMGRAARAYALTHPSDMALQPLYRAYREATAIHAGVSASPAQWVPAIERRVRRRAG